MPTPGEANAVRLLVVEDHPLFCDALLGVIAAAFPTAEVFRAMSIDGALEILASKRSIDIILLDLSMPGTTSLLGAFRVRAAAPKSALVIVSAHDSARIVGYALALGISGYVPKSTPKTELAHSIRSILEGEVYVPKRLHGRAAAKRAGAEIQPLLRQLSFLTSQQLRVLDMICRGFQNKQIAYELGISVTTVKVHVTDVLRKLGVRSRTNAIIELSRLDLARSERSAPTTTRDSGTATQS
ncbi:response regulator [Bradyrhizobium sp. CSA207]|uniref:LuxR C-terminal-related transcriptional regulator n=1 Tax=Bradyrhizobium sp. CSA207 TaxID=2698826 RepID=UPI0023AEC00B|nr:response regulator transcription factor [Bradyrhizobium sp. CSA207]MDE5445664.1 response regulator [Bradyrhizobium sp. CSA207]